jgi:hypothetical protein
VKIGCAGKPTQTDHFKLELKVVSVPKDGDGFLRPHALNGIASDASCEGSRRIRTAEFSKTDAVMAGA